MSNGLGWSTVVCAGLLVLGVAQADLIYPAPERLPPVTGDDTKSCAELDQEIVSLLPLTFNNRPGLNEDPLNGVSIWVGSMFSGGARAAYGLLGYTAYMDHEDRMRIHSAHREIEVLRRRKAHQHCFEGDLYSRGR